MGGCAGTHEHPSKDRAVEQPLPAYLANGDIVERSPDLPCAVQDKIVSPPVAFWQLDGAAANDDEEPALPNAEVYVGIPECKARNEGLAVSEISLGVAEEAHAKDKAVDLLPKTLLEDLARSQGNGPKPSPVGGARSEQESGEGQELGPKLGIIGGARGKQELGQGARKVPTLPIGRSKSKQEPGEERRSMPQLPIGGDRGRQDLLPVPPRGRSAPVMLPAAAVRSRSLPPPEAPERSPSPSPAAAAAMLPEQRSPTTALAPSRRRRRRCVTFGGAECREFSVEASAEEPCHTEILEA